MIYKRKPELSIEEIERQSRICQEIVGRYKNSFLIETSISPDEVVEKIQRIIINRFKKNK